MNTSGDVNEDSKGRADRQRVHEKFRRVLGFLAGVGTLYGIAYLSFGFERLSSGAKVFIAILIPYAAVSLRAALFESKSSAEAKLH